MGLRERIFKQSEEVEEANAPRLASLPPSCLDWACHSNLISSNDLHRKFLETEAEDEAMSSFYSKSRTLRFFPLRTNLCRWIIQEFLDSFVVGSKFVFLRRRNTNSFWINHIRKSWWEQRMDKPLNGAQHLKYLFVFIQKLLHLLTRKPVLATRLNTS